MRTVMHLNRFYLTVFSTIGLDTQQIPVNTATTTVPRLERISGAGVQGNAQQSARPE